MRKLYLFLTLSLLAAGCQPHRAESLRIPVTPAWALGHIVWEDEFNTRDSLFGLIRQYQRRDIPVDGEMPIPPDRGGLSCGISPRWATFPDARNIGLMRNPIRFSSVPRGNA